MWAAGSWSPEELHVLDLSLKHGLSLVPSCGLGTVPLGPPPQASIQASRPSGFTVAQGTGG